MALPTQLLGPTRLFGGLEYMTHTFDSDVSLHYWLLWPMVWRPPPKWNTRFSLPFPKELSYGYFRFEGNVKILLGR